MGSPNAEDVEIMSYARDNDFIVLTYDFDDKWAISSTLKEIEDTGMVTHRHYHAHIQTGKSYEDSDYIALFYIKDVLSDNLSIIEMAYEGSRLIIYRNSNELTLSLGSMRDSDIALYHLIDMYLKETGKFLTEEDFL